MGIPSTGTFRSNRIAACPPMGEKYLKKEGLGAYDYWTDQNTGKDFVKWFNNEFVLVSSTFAGVETTTILESDVKQKKKVLLQYNALIWWHSSIHQWVVQTLQTCWLSYITQNLQQNSDDIWSSFFIASKSLKSMSVWFTVDIVNNYIYQVGSAFHYDGSKPRF